jgi:hypothetical protein
VGAWDFVVGDDWRVAVGVVAALALTAVLTAAGANVWSLMPAAVLTLFASAPRYPGRESSLSTLSGRASASRSASQG